MGDLADQSRIDDRDCTKGRSTPAFLPQPALDEFFNGIGRVLVATNGCFGDAESERSGSERRAALEKLERPVWVYSVEKLVEG